LWLEQIMFRVRDAVKFGASRVCPMCNSGPAESSGSGDFGSPNESTEAAARDRVVSRSWVVLQEGAP